MGYYTRVLSRRADCPALDELRAALGSRRQDLALESDDEHGPEWTNLVLRHEDGLEIAAIERNVVGEGLLGGEEIAEFLEAVADDKPASAASWLATYLPAVKVIYAFQHLSGTEQRQGEEGLAIVRESIWARGDAILQADGEGFSNEDGYHILWQFSDEVSGPWWMAVLQDGHWERFRMELGDRAQREAFFAGRIPPGAKTA